MSVPPRANRFDRRAARSRAAVLMIAAAALSRWSTYLLAALEPDDVRAAVPGRAAARHLQPHARRRQRRTGRQGDQRPQSLHRDARSGRARTSRSSSGCRSWSARSALLFLRAAVHGTVAALRRRDRAVPLLRRVLALVVRLQAVSLRPRSGADGGGEGRRPSCRRCSATSRSRTSRSIRIRGRASYVLAGVVAAAARRRSGSPGGAAADARAGARR